MTSAAPRPAVRYGWIPDLPDFRDHLFSAVPHVMAALPAHVDLRAHCPKVYDQGRIGSCTANAIAGAFEFCLIKQGLTDIEPSRMFIYYNERAMEGHVPADSGAQLRDGVKSVATVGTCTDQDWYYDDTPADGSTLLFPAGAHATQQPTQACYTEAANNRIATYRRLPRDLDQYRGCLAGGNPFVFGFSVYAGFESQQVADTGTVPMPGRGEHFIGGHAVMAVGYDDTTRRFLVRNSWGSEWGDQGYFTLPYEYLLHRGLASDFWTITIVT